MNFFQAFSVGRSGKIEPVFAEPLSRRKMLPSMVEATGVDRRKVYRWALQAAPGTFRIFNGILVVCVDDDDGDMG